MGALGLRWHGYLQFKGFRCVISGRPTNCALFGFKQSHVKAIDRVFDPNQILAGLAVLLFSNTLLTSRSEIENERANQAMRAERGTASGVKDVQGASAMLTASITPLHERRGINNRLLLALPPVTLERILRISEPVSLVRGQQIETIGQPIKYIHFVNRGLVCATKTMEDGRIVEIAAIGLEGTTEFVALLGMDKALVDMVVRIPGTAIRIGRDAFMHELENDKPLRELMLCALRPKRSCQTHCLQSTASSRSTMLPMAPDCP
jgi:CRP-like cAMP-binding protein